jgi:hypothetical protein
MAYSLAGEVTGSRWLAWATGLLAVFGGFFFPYWTLPETFAPFAFFGALALWLAGGSREENGWRMEKGRWLLAGALVGLAHLTRADGILLLPIVAFAPFLSYEPDDPPTAENPASYASRLTFYVSRLASYVSRFTPQASWVAFRQSLFILLGYLLAMAPWFARNVAVIGAPLSPAGTKTIWLTEYDDLFCYDCDLSLASYLAWGWGNILRSKLSALWINFQRLLAEAGMVFLLPFAVIGFYRLRRRLAFLLAFLYLVLIYLAHSLVFTFPGWRGGFFHASSAVLPFLYAAGMEGLDVVVRWVARRRRTWRYQQARTVFAAAVVVIAVILGSTRAWRQIPGWRTADGLYLHVDRWLRDRGSAEATVMVSNPPAFWYHTNRSTIVIPNGDVGALVEVADRYDVQYVLLESDHPAGLAYLHAGEVSHPRLAVLDRWPEERAILYAIQP